MLWDSSFFLSTRGKLLLLLKRRGPCTVAHLSEQLGLTRNAIRQHLSSLERDNLVTQHPLKTGPTKPSLVYSLTPRAEPLFPKQYEGLLSSLIQELRLTEANPGLDHLLSRLGYSAAGTYLSRLAQLTGLARVTEVRRILEEMGTLAEWERAGEDMVIRGFNCPYAAVVKENPEVCQVQRSFLQRLLDPAPVQIACSQGEARCQFRIQGVPEGPAAG